METIKWLLASLGIWRAPPRRIALEMSILGRLPPELLLCIADVLPPIAGICFALTCSPLYQQLRSQFHLDDHPGDGVTAHYSWQQSDTNTLLELLERDLPDHVVCHSCAKLHAMSSAESFAHYHRQSYSTYPSRECSQTDFTAWFEHFQHSMLRSALFYMAMKRHRQGRESDTMLALLGDELKVEYAFAPFEVRKSRVVGRIVNGELLLRFQNVLIFKRPGGDTSRYSQMMICPHIGSLTCIFANGSRCVWESHVNTVPRMRFVSGEGLIGCCFCRTEFRVDVEALAETHFALYLTKWLNLGEGRSPRDPQWLSITFERGRPTLWQRRRLSKLGSIGSSFGDSEQYDFTSLLSSKDRKELC